MFVNYSNHPSSKWDSEQLHAANQLGGDIVDIPFPAVSSEMSAQEVGAQAELECKKIEACHPDVVMCQGEFCMSYAVISRLKEKGIKTVAACSERRVEEPSGTNKKIVTFQFVQFREYL